MEKERTDFFRVAVNIAEGGIPCKRRQETIVRMRDFPIERACNMSQKCDRETIEIPTCC